MACSDDQVADLVELLRGIREEPGHEYQPECPGCRRMEAALWDFVRGVGEGWMADLRAKGTTRLFRAIRGPATEEGQPREMDRGALIRILGDLEPWG